MFGYKRRAEAKHQAEWDVYVSKWYADHPNGEPVPPPCGIGDRLHGWIFYPKTKDRT